MGKNVARTKQQIRSAFQALAQERRFDEIRVREIAKQASINRSTFYAHFADKYALFEDFVRDRYHASLAQQDLASVTDVYAFLKAIAFETFSHVDFPERFKIDKQLEAHVSRTMQDELYQFLLPFFGDTGALVVSCTVIGVTFQARSRLRAGPIEELVYRIVAVLSDGIRLDQTRMRAAS